MAKAIPRCNTPRAPPKKSSLSQGQIKRSAKSFRRSSGIRCELTAMSMNLRDLEDFDQCPSQLIRRKRFRPSTLYVGHTRLAPRSWLVICGVPQYLRSAAIYLATSLEHCMRHFGKLVRRMAHELYLRSATRTLQQFDERTLADIGLRRAEIEHAVRNGRLATQKIMPKRIRSQQRQAA